MANLAWGLQITVLGMGLVLGVLALLWGLLVGVLRLDRPVPPDPPAPNEDPEPAVLAAIGLAIALHRSRADATPAAATPPPDSPLDASRWVTAGRARQHRGWRQGG